MSDPALAKNPTQPAPAPSETAQQRSWHRPSSHHVSSTSIGQSSISSTGSVSVPSRERGDEEDWDRPQLSVNTSAPYSHSKAPRVDIPSTISEGREDSFISMSATTPTPKKSLDYSTFTTDDDRFSGAEFLNVDSARPSTSNENGREGYFSYSAYFGAPSPGGISPSSTATLSAVTPSTIGDSPALSSTNESAEMIGRSAFPNPPPRAMNAEVKGSRLPPLNLQGPSSTRFDGPPPLGSPRIPLPPVPVDDEVELAPRPAPNASQNTITYTRTPQQRERLMNSAASPSATPQAQQPPRLLPQPAPNMTASQQKSTPPPSYSNPLSNSNLPPTSTFATRELPTSNYKQQSTSPPSQSNPLSNPPPTSIFASAGRSSTDTIRGDEFSPPSLPRTLAAPSPPPMLPSLDFKVSDAPLWSDASPSTNANGKTNAVSSSNTATATTNGALKSPISVTGTMSTHPYAAAPPSPSPQQQPQQPKIMPPELMSEVGTGGRSRSGSNAPKPATVMKEALARGRSGSNAPLPGSGMGVGVGRDRSGSNAPLPPPGIGMGMTDGMGRNRSGSNAPLPPPGIGMSMTDGMGRNRSGSNAPLPPPGIGMGMVDGMGRNRSGSNAPLPGTMMGVGMVGRDRSGSNAPLPGGGKGVIDGMGRNRSGSNAPLPGSGMGGMDGMGRNRSGSNAAARGPPPPLNVPTPSVPHPYAFPSPTMPTSHANSNGSQPQERFVPTPSTTESMSPSETPTQANFVVGMAKSAPQVAPAARPQQVQSSYSLPSEREQSPNAPDTPTDTDAGSLAGGVGGGGGMSNFQFPPPNQKPKATHTIRTPEEEEEERRSQTQESLVKALEATPQVQPVPLPNPSPSTQHSSYLDPPLTPKTIKSSSSQSTLVSANAGHPLLKEKEAKENIIAMDIPSRVPQYYPGVGHGPTESLQSHGYSHSREYSVESLNSRTHLRFRGAGLGDGDLTPDVGKESFPPSSNQQPQGILQNGNAKTHQPFPPSSQNTNRRSLGFNPGTPTPFFSTSQQAMGKGLGGHGYSPSTQSAQPHNPNHFFTLRKKDGGRSWKRTIACLGIIVIFIVVGVTVGVVVGTRGSDSKKDFALEMTPQKGTGLNGLVNNQNKKIDTTGGGKTGYGRVVVFGASWCDNGHERDSQYSGSLAPSPPYNEGRWSNGKTWAEYLAAIVGTTAKPQASYENYAYAGAVANNSDIQANVPDIPSQANAFIDRVKSSPAVFNGTDRVLLAVWVGLNSVASVYSEVLAGGRDEVEKNLAAGNEKLVQEGVTVLNAMMSIRDTSPFSDAGHQPVDLLLLPIQPGETMLRHKQTAKDAVDMGWEEQDALVVVKNLTDTYNDVLMGQLQSYSNRKETNGRSITWDASGTWYDIIGNPGSFGINNTNTACLVNNWACQDPQDYLFWDDFHSPTTIHERIAQSLQSLIAGL
ncbi:hypothetical protein BT69DRAFT_1349734 [Atractiella rhizophila]|nr:hypothetical protein BT69DRAFT_1349734 [Atractiella rhizophila]